MLEYHEGYWFREQDGAKLQIEPVMDKQECYDYWPCIEHYARTWVSAYPPLPYWGLNEIEVFDDERRAGVPITALYVAWGYKVPRPVVGVTITLIALSDKPFVWKKINP